LDSDADALCFSELNLDEQNEELRDLCLLRQLHAAAVSREDNEVQSLLAAGARVNGPDGNYGCTALHLAAMEGHSTIIAILIEHGADIDARNCLSRTPLMEAALFARLEVVNTLIQNGADKSIKVKQYHDGRWIEATARDFAGDGNSRITSYRKSQYPHYYEEPRDAPLQRRAIFSLLSDPETRDGGRGTKVTDRPPVLPPSERHKNFVPSNTTWTGHVLTFCRSFEKVLKESTSKLLPVNCHADRGVDGQFNACHVEKQLIVYYLYEHKILPWDLYQDYEHMKHVTPHRSLNPQCRITVGRQPCENCKDFARIIEEYLDLGINIELVEVLTGAGIAKFD